MRMMVIIIPIFLVVVVVDFQYYLYITSMIWINHMNNIIVKYHPNKHI